MEPVPPPAVPLEPVRELRPVANLELKAALLLIFSVALIACAALYLMYARGAFEATQTLVLVAEDSEGVVPGMDLTFAGFPIGRVRRIELSDEGNARIVVDVPTKDAHWLRSSSVFTLTRSLVGGTNIRAFSGVLKDPPLPDGAVRTVLRGDASTEITRLVASAKEMVDNLSALTAKDSAIYASLANVQDLTERLKGPGGALGVMMGNEADTKKLLGTLDRANRLLDTGNGVLTRTDGLLLKADTQLFGNGGVVPEARTTVSQLNALLGEARTSLQKVDAVLKDVQAVSSSAKEATADLGALRAEVDASLRKVDGLLDEINRKWPFKRETEVKLP